MALTLPGANDTNRAFYYDPSAPAAGNPAAYYYAPPSGPRNYPADVGSARENWKPDFSDPFFIGGRN